MKGVLKERKPQDEEMIAEEQSRNTIEDNTNAVLFLQK